MVICTCQCKVFKLKKSFNFCYSLFSLPSSRIAVLNNDFPFVGCFLLYRLHGNWVRQYLTFTTTSPPLPVQFTSRTLDHCQSMAVGLLLVTSASTSTVPTQQNRTRLQDLNNTEAEAKQFGWRSTQFSSPLSDKLLTSKTLTNPSFFLSSFYG